jgi:hypothetical protein
MDRALGSAEVETTGNQIHFFICYAIAFLVLGMIAIWYVRSVLKGRDLRFLSPLLSYGDLTAAVLVLIAFVFTRVESPFRCAGGLAFLYRCISRSPLRQRLVVHVMIFAYLLRRRRLE